MAIIKCPECGQDVSDSAMKCPHCGKQLRKPKRSIIGKNLPLAFLHFQRADAPLAYRRYRSCPRYAADG